MHVGLILDPYRFWYVFTVIPLKLFLKEYFSLITPHQVYTC